MERVPDEAVLALNALHSAAIKPELLDEALHLPAVTTRSIVNSSRMACITIGDILQSSIDLRSAGTVVLWAHGVDPVNASSLLIYRYPGIHIPSRPTDITRKSTRFDTVAAEARARIEQYHPHSSSLLSILGISRARILETRPTEVVVGERLRLSNSDLPPSTIALGGLYAIKGDKSTTIGTLVDWNEYRSQKSASLALNGALKIIRSSSSTPDALRTMVRLTDEANVTVKSIPPSYEETARLYIAGVMIKDIAAQQGVSNSAISRRLNWIIGRYDTMDAQLRPEYYQDFLEACSTRRWHDAQ